MTNLCRKVEIANSLFVFLTTVCVGEGAAKNCMFVLASTVKCAYDSLEELSLNTPSFPLQQDLMCMQVPDHEISEKITVNALNVILM